MRTTTGAWLLRVAPVAWSSLLALLMLGSALSPGLVLTYDMVWVPDLALRPDLISESSKRKILWDNAVDLYRFPDGYLPESVETAATGTAGGAR